MGYLPSASRKLRRSSTKAMSEPPANTNPKPAARPLHARGHWREAEVRTLATQDGNLKAVISGQVPHEIGKAHQHSAVSRISAARSVQRDAGEHAFPLI